MTIAQVIVNNSTDVDDILDQSEKCCIYDFFDHQINTLFYYFYDNSGITVEISGDECYIKTF